MNKISSFWQNVINGHLKNKFKLLMFTLMFLGPTSDNGGQ